jgi:hypothetical protein
VGPKSGDPRGPIRGVIIPDGYYTVTQLVKHLNDALNYRRNEDAYFSGKDYIYVGGDGLPYLYDYAVGRGGDPGPLTCTLPGIASSKTVTITGYSDGGSMQYWWRYPVWDITVTAPP